MNLAKEDSEEKTGEEVGIQAAMQMSLNQVTKENPNNCKTDFSQLMAAQAPGLWQSQLANAAARIEPPSPPAQVARADDGHGGVAAYSDHEDVNFASSEDLFAADQLLIVGRERDPEGAEATTAGSQDDNDLDDYDDDDDCNFSFSMIIVMIVNATCNYLTDNPAATAKLPAPPPVWSEVSSVSVTIISYLLSKTLHITMVIISRVSMIQITSGALKHPLMFPGLIGGKSPPRDGSPR